MESVAIVSAAKSPLQSSLCIGDGIDRRNLARSALTVKPGEDMVHVTRGKYIVGHKCAINDPISKVRELPRVDDGVPPRMPMPPPAVRILAIFLLYSAMCPLVALSDAIVVSKAMTASTIAEIFVDDNGIRVEMEIGAQDIAAFRNLLPDEVYEKLGGEPRLWAERVETFFEHDWVIRLDDGEPLPAKIVQLIARPRIRRDEITGEPVPVQPADADRVLFVELAYSWSNRPKSLAITPPLNEDRQTTMANIGFVLYHCGVAVNDFRYLGAKSTVDLDWDDPWYSRFRHRNLKRQFDAPLSVFLYVEHFEVRKEIIVRPKDLQQWIDLGLENTEVIPLEEQEPLKQQVAKFLEDRSPVMIDGQQAEGTLDRIHFIRRSLRMTGVVDPPEDLDVNGATLGVIFVYPIERLPQEVSLTWDLFTPRIQQVPAAATDEAGGLPSILSPNEPELQWRNFLTNPTTPAMIAITSPETPTIVFPLVSGICFGVVVLLIPIGLWKAKQGGGRPKRLLPAGAILLVIGVLSLPYRELRCRIRCREEWSYNLATQRRYCTPCYTTLTVHSTFATRVSFTTAWPQASRAIC